MPRKPGLPSGFKVGTKKEHLEAPAVGGSYLEETLGLSPTAAPAEPEVVGSKKSKCFGAYMKCAERLSMA